MYYYFVDFTPPFSIFEQLRTSALFIQSFTVAFKMQYSDLKIGGLEKELEFLYGLSFTIPHAYDGERNYK
jgi:hypothetical protein